MDQIYLKTNSSKMKLASYISVSTLLENVISSPLPSVSDPTVPAPGTPMFLAKPLHFGCHPSSGPAAPCLK